MARDGRARARKDGTVPVTQAEAARANAAPANTPLPMNTPPAGGDSSNAGQAGGRGARRQADRARRQITPAEMQEIQAMQARDEREEREGGEKATLQHFHKSNITVFFLLPFLVFPFVMITIKKYIQVI